MTWYYTLLAFVLFSFELLYFRAARRLGIIDKPNVRSSHADPVIRGGGIIFFVSTFWWFVSQNFQWPHFVLGLTMVAIISFLDDVKPRPALWRFAIQLCSVLLLFYQVPLFDWPVWLVLLALIICIGALNAFNFMDGINGITGVYALVNLGTFAYVCRYVVEFTDERLIYSSIIAVFVFLFFNFRKKAVCFAGDIGSVTIAFILILLLIQLIHRTNNFLWVILFLVYGIDSTVTILHRIKNRENIFNPHRTHLYQYMSNEFKWSHTTVSLLYGLIQLILNAILIYSITRSGDLTQIPIIAAIGFVACYLFVRSFLIRKIIKSMQ